MSPYDAHSPMATTRFYQGLGLLQLWTEVSYPCRSDWFTLHWTSTVGIPIRGDYDRDTLF